MGTNYTLHIGKRSALGAGQCAFTWAIPPGILSLLPPNAEVVESEYGERLTVGELMARIVADEPVFDSIGERFS